MTLRRVIYCALVALAIGGPRLAAHAAYVAFLVQTVNPRDLARELTR